MTLTTLELPATSPGRVDDPEPDMQAALAAMASARRGAVYAWMSTVRWDRVVGVLASIGTLVLILLSLLPSEPSVLSPAASEAPATSMLGGSDAGPAPQDVPEPPRP